MASRAEWSRRVGAWRGSGQSAREFAQQEGYSARTLQWWASTFRRGDGSRGPSPRDVRLVPVVVDREPETGSRPLVVELRGGHRVELERGFDAELLGQLLSVLEAR